MNLLYAGEKCDPESAPAKAAAPADEKAADGESADEKPADGELTEEADAAEDAGDADAEALEYITDQVESKGTILDAADPKAGEVMLLRFDKDYRKHLTTEALREAIRNLRIGAVDDDDIIL